MQTIMISTRKKDQVIDITDRVEAFVRSEQKADGVCHVFAAHTTCAVATADLDPGTDLDLLDALREIVPALHYRHPHDPSHTPDHILASIIGPAVSVPFRDSGLLLGTWQRIIVLEFDGPRQRTLHLSSW